MKRTLLATIDFPPMTGGVANYWANLCRELPNDSLVVLATEGPNTIDFDVKQEYLIYRHKLIKNQKWVWPKWLPLFFSIKRLIQSEKVEFLLIAHILPTGIIAYLLRHLFNIHYGLSFHGLDLKLTQANYRRRWMAARIIKSADWVIVNSEYTRSLQKEYYPNLNLKIEVIYPCPNVGITPVSPVIKENIIKKSQLENKKVLLSVGRLVERKGQDMVIKSLPLVLKAYPDLKYVIVGRGPEKERLEQLIDELQLGDVVSIYEKVGDFELPAFYELADVFILPCRELEDGDVEGFGIVFVEAGNCKKPVIAGRSGGAVEAVEENITGLLVNPLDEKEIATKILELIRKPELAKKLGENGYKRVQKYFKWSDQAKKLIKLLE